MVSAEHRTFGYNWEQDWLETSWAQGWGLAYQRMMEEAEASGAHGVIGVLDAAARWRGPRPSNTRSGDRGGRAGLAQALAHLLNFLSGARLAS